MDQVGAAHTVQLQEVEVQAGECCGGGSGHAEIPRTVQG